MAAVHPLSGDDSGPRLAPRPSRGASPSHRLLLDIATRASMPLAPATDLELVHRGDDHFDRLLEGFARARREIAVEIYQIRRDPIGWQLCSALAAAALRGVTVRLLADSFGCARVADWLTRLSDDGVEVRWYRPWRPWRWPFDRSHRKLVIVDGVVASIGGINFAAEFSEQHSGAAAWRDVGVWLAGPVVSVLEQQLRWAWRREEPEGAVPAAADPPPWRPVVDLSRGDLCAIGGGLDGRTGNADAACAMLAAARREVLLATPYFIPEPRLRRALAGAAARGVRVMVVVPWHNDISWFKQASRFLYRPLLEAGVEIRERRDRMVHAKVGVIDSEVAMVGSMNLNRQSLHGNSETLLLTTSPRAVAEVRDLVEVEAAAVSEALTPSRWSSYSDRRRVLELAAAAASLVF